ncbi:MAG: protoheme IX farnesyltransferase [Acidiphilium sp. 37-64-53]|uniref:heme o synthase n=1 Tax=Acidiphilium TaxID=522 RepID=UPI000BD2DD7A|nr:MULTISPECIES: heme o synthase [Acidiphilium]OYV61708.1 MAG: protoheme IX farnesyltransferase [Acidiphilium sp. 21-62-4]OYW00790.1 MAG: protoheme IX farnesyltransferase [Acidiphilium sp. 37-64-53]OZB27054.1 MAG: protoheme IX farnesyltransferase [Acidiphilium sp. 34-64-41]HQT85796.1 heme o synthase [Acidiphilium rubrum]
MSDTIMRTSAPAATVEPALLDQAILGATTSDWLALLKPRVLYLVVYTGAAGLLVAPGPLNPVLAFTAILCIAMAAGAAGAINMWYDRDIDAIMRRTAKRPVPAGRISPSGALSFGVGLSFLSVLLMWLATNVLAAAILALSIAFYVFIYTMWLKRRTPQNIVIGGAAGAFPPIIGWVAVTGHLALLPIVLFALIFIWTPPHFWSLSLFASADYEKAGVPMLPVVAGAKATRRAVMSYTLWMVPISLLPYILHEAGPFYGASALVLGLAFIWYAIGVMRDRQDPTGVSLTRDAPAKAAFKYSILYLFLIFGALVVDHFL